MKHYVAAALVGVGLLAAPESVFAKAATVKIEIGGAALATPLEITDSEIVSRFNIWNGPGVAVNGRPVHLNPDNQYGMFIDWSRGMASERPAGLLRYQVTFRLEAARAPGPGYVVFYEFDPATAGGYIYLPGRGDEQGKSNTFLIYHGVEGNWFYCSRAWESFVRPLVEQAANRAAER